MTRVERLADHLAVSINRNAPNASSVAVLRYSLISVINQLITIAIVLTVCLLTSDLPASIIAIIAFPLLRYFSGGLHLRSANLCNYVTSFLMLVSIYTPVNYWYNGIIINLIAISILIFTAPNGIKRSRLDPKYFPVIKLISIIIVCSNFLFQSHVLSMVFLLQAITTLPIMQKTIDRYNM